MATSVREPAFVAALAAGGIAGFVHGSGPATAAANAPAAPVTQADARQAYLRDCATCHGADARGTAFGPTLQGVGPAAVDYWVSTGRMPLVANSRPAKSPQGQPPPGQVVADPNAPIRRKTPIYSPEMIAALVYYVSSIAPGGPAIPHVDTVHANLADGGQVFRLQCAACHSWSGVGGALYQRAAPSLKAATPTQIAEAMRIRPDQMPAFGTAAIPANQLDDVVAYVRYLEYNFAEIPTVSSRHPLWEGGAPSALPEPDPPGVDETGAPVEEDPAVRSLALVGAFEKTSTITSGRDPRPSDVLYIPEQTAVPLAVAFGLAVFFVGLLIDASVVGVAGVALVVVAAVRWLWKTDMDRDQAQTGGPDGARVRTGDRGPEGGAA